MAEYIEREKVLNLFDKVGCYLNPKCLERQKQQIEQLPTADVVEVKHGEWKVEDHKEHLNVICTNCNKDFYVYKKGQYRIDVSNYCPYCGAKMDKRSEGK